jgi:hypothetical protein
VHRYTGKAVDLCLFQDIAPDMLPAATDNNNISSFGYTFLDEHARYRTGWLGGNAGREPVDAIRPDTAPGRFLHDPPAAA